MAVQIHGTRDPVTEAYAAQLGPYAAARPGAEVDVYRYSPVSVRVRLIDPTFQGKDRSERHKAVWPILNELDRDVLDELTMLVLISPDEQETSVVNRDFNTGIFTKAFAAAVDAGRGGGAAP